MGDIPAADQEIEAHGRLAEELRQPKRAFAQRNEEAEETLRIRIGLHTGEAIKEGADFFGKHVNLTARIASHAQGEEILVSSLLKELTEAAGEFSFSDGQEVELKGLKGAHRLFAVQW